MLKKNQGYWGR